MPGLHDLESLPIGGFLAMILKCGVAGKSPWNTRIHPFPPMNQRENMLNWVKRSGPYKLYKVLDDAGERGNSLAGSQQLQLFATQWDSFKSKPFFTFSMISHGWIGWSWGSPDWIRPYMRAIILSYYHRHKRRVDILRRSQMMVQYGWIMQQ